jgi:hypothetical protein
MEPALEMEFAAHFARADGEFAAQAATVAVTRVIDAPLWFLAPVLNAGRSASSCLLERSSADLCRIVLTADRTGITVAATDDVRVPLHSGTPGAASNLPLLAVVNDLNIHHGPDGHVWVVWQGAWQSTDSNSTPGGTRSVPEGAGSTPDGPVRP